MHKQNIFKICVVVVVMVVLPLMAWANHDEDNWIEPNKWTLEDKEFATQHHKPFEECNTVPSDDSVAHIYFKKFIGNLFSRKKMQYDKANEMFQRTIVFKLLPAQLERLEHLSDPRDLDTVLTEIFQNAQSIVELNNVASAAGGRCGVYQIVNDETSMWSLTVDILKDIWQILKISEVQFLIWVMAAILMGWFINRRYQIGVGKMIVCSFLFFGYLYTYIECNRKLDVERMLEVLNHEQQQQQPSGLWEKVFGSTKTDQNNNLHIKKAKRIELPICRPDHVAIMYVNDLLIKQIEQLIDKCTSTFLTLKDSLSFPFNYIAGIIMVVLIGYIFKLTFKYILSPTAWAHLLNQPAPTAVPPPQPSHAKILHVTSEDRVSGENLKMLLNVLNDHLPSIKSQKEQQQQQLQETPTIAAIGNSGVQELNGAETKEVDTSSSNSSTPSKTNDNNNSSESKPCSENHNESNDSINQQEKSNEVVNVIKT